MLSLGIHYKTLFKLVYEQQQKNDQGLVAALAQTGQRAVMEGIISHVETEVVNLWSKDVI